MCTYSNKTMTRVCNIQNIYAKYRDHNIDMIHLTWAQVHVLADMYTQIPKGHSDFALVHIIAIGEHEICSTPFPFDLRCENVS